MKYRIVHNTTYEYTDNAEACHNLVRLQPRTISGAALPRNAAVGSIPSPASLHSTSTISAITSTASPSTSRTRQLSITAESYVALTPPDVEPRRRLARLGTTCASYVARAIGPRRSSRRSSIVFDSPYIRTSRTLARVCAAHISRPTGRWARPSWR